MSLPEDFLYQLLPAVHRLRDGGERGEPLREYLEVLTDQAAVVDENLRLLYDDLFVETAAPWVLPYLADLLGVRGLPGQQTYGLTPRAEVANTIGYRRRRGTAAVLEQLARDVTGWSAKVVEYFELLATTQHVNHIRAHSTAVSGARGADGLAWLDTPFERLPDGTTICHTPDVRRISTRRGRYNIPNVGLHVWRQREYGLTRVPAAQVPEDPRRFRVDPLGTDSQLVTLPLTEAEISHLAEPVNVPLPISRRMMSRTPGAYYGSGLSVVIDGVPVDDIVVCDLGDVEAGGVVPGWAHTPPAPGTVALDPERGRLAFPDDQPQPPLVSYHYGFTADIGGGEYRRVDSLAVVDGEHVRVSQQHSTADHATIAGGVNALSGPGTVEIADSGRYGDEDGDGTLAGIDATGRRLQVAAVDGRRPVVRLSDDATITGDDDGELILSGLVIVGGALFVRGVRVLRLRHCTLVPGTDLTPDGEPETAGAASLFVTSPNVDVEIESSIVGGLRVHPDARLSAHGSIVDAGPGGIAYASDDDAGAGGGPLGLSECTVLGKVHARVLDVVSNSILLATVTEDDDPGRWPGPVLADRRQTGCVRFSYLPPGSRTPRRHRCQPADTADSGRLRPTFTSQRYGDPGYCQLTTRTPTEITRGADDESEMGAFHDLYQPQREQHLRTRLDEYLRFGLDAGIFFAS